MERNKRVSEERLRKNQSSPASLAASAASLREDCVSMVLQGKTSRVILIACEPETSQAADRNVIFWFSCECLNKNCF